MSEPIIIPCYRCLTGHGKHTCDVHKPVAFTKHEQPKKMNKRKK